MKTFLNTLIILCLATITVTTASAQQAVGNSKVNTDFSKYHTFTWAKSDPTEVGANGYDIYYYEFEPANKLDKVKQGESKDGRNVSTQEPYVYSYSVIIPATNEAADAVIKDAISNELEGRGYREDPASGDLVVAYQVLEKRAQLHGYRNDDPKTVSGGQQVREPADTATFALEPGTLIISLIDKNTSQMVWDGFSRNMNKNDVFITDEVELKKAVHNIFNEFKYSAGRARKD